MIRFNIPTIEKKDLEAVLNCMIGDDLNPGAYMRKFSDMLRKTLSLSNVAVYNSSFHALETVFSILGVEQGDEVILPSFSRYRLLDSVLRSGLTPVLVDVEEDSFLPLKERIEKKINSRTRCIIISQMFGLPNDLDSYRTFGVPLIEDLDGSLCAAINDKKIGSFGDFVTMNFNDDAIITTGNGGMLASRDVRLKQIILSYREDEFSPDYLMSDFNASLGISQLKKLERMTEKRRKIGRILDDAVLVSNCTLIGRRGGQELCYSSYVVKTQTPLDDILRFFKKYQIPVKRGIRNPLHRYLKLDPKEFRNTEELYGKTVVLPLYPSLGKDHVENIARGIRAVL